MIRTLLSLAFTVALTGAPISLHPRNPHYFLLSGKPAVLVTSGEHYGAVLNLDFDYKLYLKTLAADRLNLTRIFSGAYRERPGNFRIARNTLAPAPGRFIAPWPESNGKFDLNQWNEAYFQRLRDFLHEASRAGVVVEMNLFCPYYEESMWELSPLNARNNVNGIGTGARTDALTLKDPRLLEVEDAMVRKIVTELRDFDNLYYEICNEPYFGGVTLEWQRHIARTIVDAEAGMTQRHLISQNIANHRMKVENPDPLVSLLNFHYARPPEAVADNFRLEKAIGCNETGFDGNSDAVYRIQGWDFLMAGGALYNNLDYSFTAGHEDGTFAYPAAQPGGGSAALRRQLGILRAFFDRLDLVHMRPLQDAIVKPPEDTSARLLVSEGELYVLYLHRGHVVKGSKPQYQVNTEKKPSALALDLPRGNYQAEWHDTRTDRILRRNSFRHAGGARGMESPAYSEDTVLRLKRTA